MAIEPNDHVSYNLAVVIGHEVAMRFLRRTVLASILSAAASSHAAQIQYEYVFSGDVSSDIIVTTSNSLSAVTNEPGSFAYAVTSITGTWSGLTITGMAETGNTFAYGNGVNWDNAIFPSDGGVGSMSGIDNAGIAFKLTSGTVINVYTESGSWKYADTAGGLGGLNLASYMPLIPVASLDVQRHRRGNCFPPCPPLKRSLQQNRPAAHNEAVHDPNRQGCRLSQSRCRDEGHRRTPAADPATATQVPEKHR
jgi:hypothetical protein